LKRPPYHSLTGQGVDSERTLHGWVNRITQPAWGRHKLYLQCYTAQEIADVVGLKQQTVDDEIQTFTGNGNTSESGKTANFQDDFKQPLYNLWSFGVRARVD